MNCDETRDLLPGLIDGELGVRETLDIGNHLAGCAECSARLASYQSLQVATKEHATYFHAPQGLERRIEAALPSLGRHEARSAKRTWSWINVGLAFASVAALAWSVDLYLTLPSAEERLGDEVVSTHVRSLLSTRNVDVASSDRHTVKPWFNGKVDFSPPVYDLTAEGFPLIGGRLDYLDHREVAALVYGHRQHVIDVFVSPASNNGADAAPKSLTLQGYNMLHWTRAGMAFWAVSDVEPAELVKLSELLRSHD